MTESLSGYRIFYEVANCGNISRAASILYISQPAISKSIQKLEEQLETKLFIRSSKGVILTGEGKMLYQTVQEVFSSLDAGVEKLRQHVSMGMGSLRIGVSSTLCKHVLLPYLTQFSKENPKINLSITTSSSKETLSLIEEQKIDVGLVSQPDRMDDLIFEKEGSIQDCFVATPEYLQRFSHASGDFEKILRHANLMMLEKDNLTRMYIEDHLRLNQIRSLETFAISDMDLLISFAKIGVGIAAVIRNFVQEELDSGQLIELALPHHRAIPPRQIGFVYKKSHLQNPALGKFLELKNQEENSISS